MTHLTIYDAIKHDWKIHPSLHHRLSNHYILHWDPTYLFSTWKSGPITREGIMYLRIYHRCTEQEVKNSKVALLSFRKVPELVYGFVLITPARNLEAIRAIRQTAPIIDFKSQLPVERS
jgi:hypothetical protein